MSEKVSKPAVSALLCALVAAIRESLVDTSLSQEDEILRLLEENVRVFEVPHTPLSQDELAELQELHLAFRQQRKSPLLFLYLAQPPDSAKLT